MGIIQIKRSTTVSAVPVSLAPGELAINETDRKLFSRNGAGAVIATNLDQPSSAFKPLHAQDASNDATIEFTDDWSAHKTLLVTWSGVRPATNDQQLLARLSDDGNSTFETSGYQYSLFRVGAQESSPEDFNANEFVFGRTSAGDAYSSTAGRFGSGYMFIHAPGNTGDHVVQWHQAFREADTGNVEINFGGGFLESTGNAINGIQWRFESGNVAEGHFAVYALGA